MAECLVLPGAASLIIAFWVRAGGPGVPDWDIV